MKKLESDRLILREWKISDLDDLHDLVSNKEVATLAGFTERTNKEDTLKILNKFIKDVCNDRFFLWAVQLKESNKVIGWIELHDPLEEIDLNSKEIGFVLSQSYWGQGLMAEVIKKVTDYGFCEEKADSIVCVHFAYNNQCKRVIEKCGFKCFKKSNDKIYYRLDKSL